MSDRIAVFNDGIVQQPGTPGEIYSRPANPFVAQFIGDNNAITARVVELAFGIDRMMREQPSLFSMVSIRIPTMREMTDFPREVDVEICKVFGSN